ncbi:hypothetical protein Pmani_019654 [Petrolisthes manimaculis]|uniref:Uncharacterized protein n=1 Tax=Petrolisthes manimaculis TaxID=1843537 RepID=A0AAE1PJY6_9EUCA|nr:hypothetical protein Pmani_019654 [Petrolisthes manimaculis]
MRRTALVLGVALVFLVAVGEGRPVFESIGDAVEGIGDGIGDFFEGVGDFFSGIFSSRSGTIQSSPAPPRLPPGLPPTAITPEFTVPDNSDTVPDLTLQVDPTQNFVVPPDSHLSPELIASPQGPLTLEQAINSNNVRLVVDN